MTYPTIGCDPEFFLKDKKSKSYVTAIDRVGGTKKEPLKVKDGWLQEDGCALEIGTEPVSSDDTKAFVEKVSTVLQQAQERVGDGMEISPVSSVLFDKEALKDPRAWLCGCDPDYSIVTQCKNLSREYGKEDYRRYAGGHIHIGHEFILNNPRNMGDVVRYMDLYVGLPLYLKDKDEYRIEFYGNWGNFRPKPYGIEYRTASNIWTADKDSIAMVCNAVRQSVETVRRAHIREVHDNFIIQWEQLKANKEMRRAFVKEFVRMHRLNKWVA